LIYIFKIHTEMMTHVKHKQYHFHLAWNNFLFLKNNLINYDGLEMSLHILLCTI